MEAQPAVRIGSKSGNALDGLSQTSSNFTRPLGSAGGTFSLDLGLGKEGEAAVDYVHPVQRALDRFGPRADEIKRMRAIAAEQGMAAPMKLAMERRILSSLRPRLPGFASSHPLAAQLDGSLDEIGFEDFLNSETFQFSFHNLPTAEEFAERAVDMNAALEGPSVRAPGSQLQHGASLAPY